MTAGAGPGWPAKGERTMAGSRFATVRLALTLLVMACLVATSAEVRAGGRPVVLGTHGMVAANHPLAAQAGLAMLRDGGNAVDAAITAAAVLNLVEPMMSGAGGSTFMLHYEAATGRVQALNASDVAPRAVRLEDFPGTEPAIGPRAATVPGTLDAWSMALARYGTRGWDTVLAPAIRLAREGVPCSDFFVEQVRLAEPLLRRTPESSALFLPAGRVPHTGERFRNPGLARTFERIVEAARARQKAGRADAIRAGRDAFYRGAIAADIVAWYRDHGGLLDAVDLAAYEARWVEPMQGHYRGRQVFVPPPNSSGASMLEALAILEGFDLARLGRDTPAHLHVLAETFKQVRADRARAIVDPGVETDTASSLLDPASIAERRSAIRMDAAAQSAASSLDASNTTHLTVVDGDGDIVVLTSTMGGATALFGTGAVVGNTGLLFVDGINWMDRDPAGNNRIRGGARPRWSMSPTLVLEGGRPWLAIGTPGGEGIWQTLPQVISNLVDFGMNIQDAIEAPRLRGYAGMSLKVEGRVAPDTTIALTGLGHVVTRLPDWTQEVGGVNGVRFLGDGVLAGGADPRREGYVAAW